MAEHYLDLENLLLSYEDNIVHIVIEDGTNEPWFNAKNVAKMLNYIKHKDTIKLNVSIQNKKQLTYLVSDFKLLYKNAQGQSYFINENGFNELIIKSNKPERYSFG